MSAMKFKMLSKGDIPVIANCLIQYWKHSSEITKYQSSVVIQVIALFILNLLQVYYSDIVQLLVPNLCLIIIYTQICGLSSSQKHNIIESAPLDGLNSQSNENVLNGQIEKSTLILPKISPTLLNQKFANSLCSPLTSSISSLPISTTTSTTTTSIATCTTTTSSFTTKMSCLPLHSNVPSKTPDTISQKFCNQSVQTIDFSSHDVINVDHYTEIASPNVENCSAQTLLEVNGSSSRISDQLSLPGYKSIESTDSDLDYNSILSFLPKFGGNYKKFRPFKLKFTKIVDHMNLTEKDKALLLYLSLEESVVNCLGSVGPEDQINYQQLWYELGEYCRPQHGLLLHEAALNSLSNWDICDTYEKLLELYNFLLPHCKALERDKAGKDDLAVGITVLSKLRGELADQVTSVLKSYPENSVMPDILTAIREQLDDFELSEIIQISNGETECTNIEILGKDDLIGNCKPSVKSCLKKCEHTSLCIFCKSANHSSAYCRKYRQPIDFQHSLFKQYACFNCMQSGHKSYACPMPKMCSLCNDPRKHCQVLCNQYFDNNH